MQQPQPHVVGAAARGTAGCRLSFVLRREAVELLVARRREGRHLALTLCVYPLKTDQTREEKGVEKWDLAAETRRRG